MAADVPKHWSGISWEEKARENPLYAVMTTDEVADARADNFDPKHLEAFFAKGEALFAKHIAPLLARSPDAKADTLVMEYGCGAGRLIAQVIKAGYRCAGIDISETMLRHCRDLVPDVEATHLLGDDGECDAKSGSASIVYSYAVVQHISKLSNYERAFDVMCRVLKPGGVIAVQVNCEDFVHGDIDTPWRTDNEEDRSLHFRPGENAPYRVHKQDDWAGVYIGHERLMKMFEERGIAVERRYYHNLKKLRGVWYVGVKRA